ncbi:hypothetical protein [uncultured Maribacter sp.]|uniref:hypothetical protein n=1 Tax=uncultured Maribacter sp. TaxID=431308 RepID=UPI00261E91E0|nr:hypothetical protein [uncultured Maribacter sp.]
MLKYMVLIVFVLTAFNCQQKEEKVKPEKVVNGGLVYKMFEQMKSNGQMLFSKEVKNDTLNKLKIILKEKQKLVFRFNTASCGICVDSVLLNLNRFSKENNLKNEIVILTAYENNRDLHIFKKINNVNFNVLNFKEGDLNIPSDKGHKPFLFVTDSTLICKSFFIPEKSWPFLTKKYLEHIKETYFNEINEKK